MAATRVNVAIYCRISKDKSGRKANVKVQERDCRDLCEVEGWTVKQVFVDNDISAADPTKSRDRYDEMMTALAKGGFDVVVVTMADRLHRQPDELGQFVKAFLNSGMSQVATVRSGTFDLTTPNGLYNFRQEGNSAEREIGMLKLRIKRKKRAKAEAGEWNGGIRPFGYGFDPVDDTLQAKAAALARVNEVNPEEAALIKEAAQRILEGNSLRSISKDWIARGVLSTWGKPIFEITIKKVLISPRVIGKSQYQGEIVGDAQWPPILDEVTWEQVKTILTDPSRRRQVNQKSHALRGVLRCGRVLENGTVCGTGLTASPRSEGRRYVCHSRHGCGKLSIKADAVEEYVFALLLPMADSPDMRNVLRAEDEQGTQRVREILVANAKDEAKTQEYSDMFDEDEIDRATYVKRSGKLRDRITAREAQLTTIRGKSALSRLGGSVMAEWDEMSADDQRSILLSLVTDITVKPVLKHGYNHFDPDRLNIGWRTEAIQKMVHLYRGADGGWRVPAILFSTDPKQPLPESISRGRLLTPDEIKKMKKKGRPVPKSQAS
jgi:site-specific DNA recombinase